MSYKLGDKVRITHKDFDDETGTIVLISSNPRFYRYRVLLDTDTKYSYGFDEDDLELAKESCHDEMQKV